MELGPHPAYSFGATTRAAVAALLGGFLPRCTVKDCEHNKVSWTNPFFLTNMRKRTNLYLAIPNGWALELLTSFMSENLRRKNLYWHGPHEKMVSPMILDHFEQTDYDDYFFYLHVQETHPPFSHPDWKGIKQANLPEPSERRKMSLEWVDENIIDRVLKYDYDQLVVCADHPLKHDVPEHKAVFLASNGFKDLW